MLSQKKDFFLETINTYIIKTGYSTIPFCHYGLTMLLASIHVIQRQRLQHHTFPLLVISNDYFPGEMDLQFPWKIKSFHIWNSCWLFFLIMPHIFSLQDMATTESLKQKVFEIAHNFGVGFIFSESLRNWFRRGREKSKGRNGKDKQRIDLTK